MSDSSAHITPAQKQYLEIKAQYPDAILFFRMGDFYETFDEDAKICSRELGLTLTTRNKNSAQPQPLAGIPYHAVDKYLPRLNQKGYKVAICEQTSDPQLPGIVERRVVRIVTPGTSLSENYLESKTNNYVAAICEENNRFGWSYTDYSTGEWKTQDGVDLTTLTNALLRLQPTEVILPPGLFSEADLRAALDTGSGASITFYPPLNDPTALLQTHFGVRSLESLGLTQKPLAVAAAGLLLNYLIDTQMVELHHLNNLQLLTTDYLELDAATIRHLEIFANSYDQTRRDTLWELLDETLTAMGGRRLRRLMWYPLRNPAQIQERLDGLTALLARRDRGETLRQHIANIYDIERLLSKATSQRLTPRDLLALRTSLDQLPSLITAVGEIKATYLATLHQRLQTVLNSTPLTALTEQLRTALADEAPLTISEGGIFRAGYHAEVDRYRALVTGGREWIINYEAEERAKTGLNTLKVKFNNVFGYFIELSQREAQNALPPQYTRKQTLVNAERFITPELKRYEDEVLQADEKLKALEMQLFEELRQAVLQVIPPLQLLAETIADLDVLQSFALVSHREQYCAPTLTTGDLVITEGRHPILAHNLKTAFVPNDVQLSASPSLWLITGPNMAGKSTFLRQNALILYLLHLGMYVPAQSAQLPVIDRLYTRIGASDYLSRGRSTFMVEMEETAYILRNATAQSFIILDEIGRGTSTYDGLAIAWAIVEYLQHTVHAKTLFATHYHELIPVIENLPDAANYSVAVSENEQGVVFLHKIVPGGVDQSYGLEVARLAGLPAAVLNRSQEILTTLEEDQPPLPASGQLTFLSPQVEEKIVYTTHPVTEQLKELDLNNLTPLQALSIMQEWKNKL